MSISAPVTTTLIQELKNDTDSLTKKCNMETNIKEKYFEMWRASEKEKDRIKTTHSVFRGFQQKLTKEPGSNREILKIDPSMLEDVDGPSVELGRGRFGTVVLKQFRSSPVAVKYFDSSSTPKLVEREASFLAQCCHINLPLIYGMNNTHAPFFIVTQFYGSESFKPVTLRGVIKEEAEVSTESSENWLHILTQLCDCLSYIHRKDIIHNDIKNDNIVIVCNSKGCFSPILIAFGKACPLTQAKKKILTEEEKSYVLQRALSHCS